MATDLNLHRRTTTMAQDTTEGRSRDKEVHNRERTWLICYILDRSMSAQMGKPHSIKEESVPRDSFETFTVLTPCSHIIQNTQLFWAKYIASKSDFGVAAYAVRIPKVLAGLQLIMYMPGTSTNTLPKPRPLVLQY